MVLCPSAAILRTILWPAGRYHPRHQARDGVTLDDLDEESRAKLREMPDPEPLLDFADAVRSRQPAGGNAETAHRTATVLHLANIAIRVGQKIRTLVDGPHASGIYQVTWNCTDRKGIRVANGIYFYRLQWNGQDEIKKMVLLE